MTSIGQFSKFSAESPPFNPHMHRKSSSNGASPLNSHGGGSMGGSRSTSPYPYYNTIGNNMTNTANNSSSSNNTNNNNNIPLEPLKNSNAVAKYTFSYGETQLEIRNVWADNVEEEMAVIRELVEKYPYVAMDTEFPGIVAKPVITETYTPDYHYRSLKVNVDLLKIIQLGLSFADERGNLAPGCPCWQFNFKFDLEDDMFAQDSIDLLQNSGISFEDHAKRGIDPLLFGELLMVSGLVLDDRVKWVSFHSGYDYGYLLKLLTTVDLPSEEKTFFELLKIYFPTIYDVKYMTSLLDGHQFMGGLQRLADDLQCQRMGVEHQAGSDSLLTMSSFFALIKAKFGAKPKDPNDPTSPIVYENSKFCNELFGYGTNHTVRKQGNVGLVGGGNTNTINSMVTFNNTIMNNMTRDTSNGSVLSSGSND